VETRAHQLVADFERITIREFAVDIQRAVELGLELGITRTTRTSSKLPGRLDSRCSRWTARSGGMQRSWACP
jgi:hypothetical protein